MRNLFPAQSYAGWYENLTNQLGHQLLGQFIGLALVTVAHAIWPSSWTAMMALAIGIVGYVALWEVEDKPDWDWIDSLSDTAHVAGGMVMS